MQNIDIKIVNPVFNWLGLSLPSYATKGSAGLDLRACIPAAVTLEPGKTLLVKTGLAIDLKDHGLVALIASRSGLALKHQVIVLNSPGVIDSDFIGEIGVILSNLGTEPFVIQPGDRIAQMLIQPVLQVNLTEVSEFTTESERGTGGFGSTGKN